MTKTDYISGTEDAYKKDPENVTLEVLWEDSLPKSYKVKFKCDSSKEVIVPKSICNLSLEPDGIGYNKRLLTVPVWFLKKEGIKYEISN